LEKPNISSQFHRKNIRKSNEKLWDAAEGGEEVKVLEMLDSTIQAYPAEIDSKQVFDC